MFFIYGLGVGQTFWGKVEVSLAWNKNSGLPSALFFKGRAIYLNARPSGRANPSLPQQARAKQQPLPAPPNTPKTTTHFCQRDEPLLLEEIFGVVELGAQFAMTLTRLEGAEVAQPDTASAF